MEGWTTYKYCSRLVRVHLEKNPRYERHPMIPYMEWKSMVEDGKEKVLRKERKIPPGIGRYAIHSKM